MNCDALSTTVSWSPSIGAVSYVTMLAASSGHKDSCTTNNTQCQPSSLQCGEKYSVTVMAQGETCNTSAQMSGYLTTGTT